MDNNKIRQERQEEEKKADQQSTAINHLLNNNGKTHTTQKKPKTERKPKTSKIDPRDATPSRARVIDTGSAHCPLKKKKSVRAHPHVPVPPALARAQGQRLSEVFGLGRETSSASSRGNTRGWR